MIPKGILEIIVKTATEDLLMSGAVLGARPLIERAVKGALITELEVEKQLLVEADKIIEAHRGKIKGEGADIESLRQKIVAKLARERKIVL